MQKIPNKALGQHFLINKVTCQRIVDLLGDISNSTVVEVGPGVGALTKLLIPKAKRLILVEKDPTLEDFLKEISKGHASVSYILQDALNINLNELVGGEKFMIISNLPYNVGTALFLNWLHLGSNVTKMVLMLQKEVATKICALKGASNYGRLSVISHLLSDVHYQFDVGPNEFAPPPKVDSGVIVARNLAQTRYSCNLTTLKKVTEMAFAQRRKMLRQSLKSLKLNFEELGINPQLRAQNLSSQEFCAIANYVDKSPT